MLEYHGKNGSTYSVKEERLGKGGEGSIHEKRSGKCAGDYH